MFGLHKMVGNSQVTLELLLSSAQPHVEFSTKGIISLVVGCEDTKTQIYKMHY
jgi:hypothetical protein